MDLKSQTKGHSHERGDEATRQDTRLDLRVPDTQA